MYPTGDLHNADLQKPQEPHELEDKASVQESAVFVLADPPYNVPCHRDSEKSEHDWLPADDMKATVRLGGAILKPKGLGHLYCIAMQLLQWY